jgi:hypothetical protein
MIIVAEILVALLGLSLLLLALVKASPATLASILRYGGIGLLLALGAVMTAAGRAGLGVALVALGVFLAGRALWSRRLKEARRRRSVVRTAALEMEVDHDTGVMEAMVLAGRSEGRALGQMSKSELMALHRELSTLDPESTQLLETYLDGRFPGWREHTKSNDRGRLACAPGSSPMTKEEAYKILGLEAGAAASDVREAHRRLLQCLEPDVGGASFLAARINQAKDILLSDHD